MRDGRAPRGPERLQLAFYEIYGGQDLGPWSTRAEKPSPSPHRLGRSASRTSPTSGSYANTPSALIRRSAMQLSPQQQTSTEASNAELLTSPSIKSLAAGRSPATPKTGGYADRHSLRSSYASNPAAAVVSPASKALTSVPGPQPPPSPSSSLPRAAGRGDLVAKMALGKNSSAKPSGGAPKPAGATTSAVIAALAMDASLPTLDSTAMALLEAIMSPATATIPKAAGPAPSAAAEAEAPVPAAASPAVPKPTTAAAVAAAALAVGRGAAAAAGSTVASASLPRRLPPPHPPVARLSLDGPFTGVTAAGPDAARPAAAVDQVDQVAQLPSPEQSGATVAPAPPATLQPPDSRATESPRTAADSAPAVQRPRAVQSQPRAAKAGSCVYPAGSVREAVAPPAVLSLWAVPQMSFQQQASPDVSPLAQPHAQLVDLEGEALNGCTACASDSEATAPSASSAAGGPARHHPHHHASHSATNIAAQAATASLNALTAGAAGGSGGALALAAASGGGARAFIKRMCRSHVARTLSGRSLRDRGGGRPVTYAELQGAARLHASLDAGPTSAATAADSGAADGYSCRSPNPASSRRTTADRTSAGERGSTAAAALRGCLGQGQISQRTIPEEGRLRSATEAAADIVVADIGGCGSAAAAEGGGSGGVMVSEAGAAGTVAAAPLSFSDEAGVALQPQQPSIQQKQQQKPQKRGFLARLFGCFGGGGDSGSAQKKQAVERAVPPLSATATAAAVITVPAAAEAVAVEEKAESVHGGRVVQIAAATEPSPPAAAAAATEEAAAVPIGPPRMPQQQLQQPNPLQPSPRTPRSNALAAAAGARLAQAVLGSSTSTLQQQRSPLSGAGRHPAGLQSPDLAAYEATAAAGGRRTPRATASPRLFRAGTEDGDAVFLRSYDAVNPSGGAGDRQQRVFRSTSRAGGMVDLMASAVAVAACTTGSAFGGSGSCARARLLRAVSDGSSIAGSSTGMGAIAGAGGVAAAAAALAAHGGTVSASTSCKRLACSPRDGSTRGGTASGSGTPAARLASNVQPLPAAAPSPAGATAPAALASINGSSSSSSSSSSDQVLAPSPLPGTAGAATPTPSAPLGHVLSRKRTRANQVGGHSLAQLDAKKLAALSLEDMLEAIQAAIEADDLARGRATAPAAAAAISADGAVAARVASTRRRRSGAGARGAAAARGSRCSDGGVGAVQTTPMKAAVVGGAAAASRRRRKVKATKPKRGGAAVPLPAHSSPAAAATAAAAASQAAARARDGMAASLHPVWRHGGRALAFGGFLGVGLTSAPSSIVISPRDAARASLDSYFVRQPPYKKKQLAKGATGPWPPPPPPSSSQQMQMPMQTGPQQPHVTLTAAAIGPATAAVLRASAPCHPGATAVAAAAAAAASPGTGAASRAVRKLLTGQDPDQDEHLGSWPGTPSAADAAAAATAASIVTAAPAPSTTSAAAGPRFAAAAAAPPLAPPPVLTSALDLSALLSCMGGDVLTVVGAAPRSAAAAAAVTTAASPANADTAAKSAAATATLESADVGTKSKRVASVTAAAAANSAADDGTKAGVAAATNGAMLTQAQLFSHLVHLISGGVDGTASGGDAAKPDAAAVPSAAVVAAQQQALVVPVMDLHLLEEHHHQYHRLDLGSLGGVLEEPEMSEEPIIGKGCGGGASLLQKAVTPRSARGAAVVAAPPVTVISLVELMSRARPAAAVGGDHDDEGEDAGASSGASVEDVTEEVAEEVEEEAGAGAQQGQAVSILQQQHSGTCSSEPEAPAEAVVSPGPPQPQRQQQPLSPMGSAALPLVVQPPGPFSAMLGTAFSSSSAEMATAISPNLSRAGSVGIIDKAGGGRAASASVLSPTTLLSPTLSFEMAAMTKPDSRGVSYLRLSLSLQAEKQMASASTAAQEVAAAPLPECSPQQLPVNARSVSASVRCSGGGSRGGSRSSGGGEMGRRSPRHASRASPSTYAAMAAARHSVSLTTTPTKPMVAAPPPPPQAAAGALLAPLVFDDSGAAVAAALRGPFSGSGGPGGGFWSSCSATAVTPPSTVAVAATMGGSGPVFSPFKSAAVGPRAGGGAAMGAAALEAADSADARVAASSVAAAPREYDIHAAAAAEEAALVYEAALSLRTSAGGGASPLEELPSLPQPRWVASSSAATPSATAAVSPCMVGLPATPTRPPGAAALDWRGVSLEEYEGSLVEFDTFLKSSGGGSAEA